MKLDIARVLISQHQIARRVREMAEQITKDHSPPAMQSDAEITIVPILTGALVFAADLIRHIPMHMQIGLLTVSSYPGASIRTQGSQVISKQFGDLTGRHVLVLDDILDSGGTIRTVVPVLQEAGAASVKTCVLLRKDRPIARETQADYIGFDIPDEFVVGYGLDFNNYYRNVPDIVTLNQAAIDARS